MSSKAGKVLTAKIAEKAIARDDCDLYEYTDIEDAAAEVLARYDGSLSLGGLTHITDSTAKHLGNHKGSLWLNGLHCLSAETANTLSKHQGGLWLWGLKTLDSTCALHLAKTSGMLSLTGLTVLSDEIIEILADHNDSLDLSGLTSLSLKGANALFKSQHELLLNGLTSLSPEVAAVLASCCDEGSHSNGYRSFGGLEHATDELFDIFSKYEEGLAWDSYARIPNGPRGIYAGCLYDIEKVASTKGNDEREFVVGLSFDYCDRNYKGYKIMQRIEIQRLMAALGTGCKVGTPNMPGEWHEEFDISLLKDSFQIHSPWPCDIKAVRELFGDSVGETSLFDSVLEHAPESRLDDDAGDS